MSWFSNLFGKLFGRDTATANAERAPKAAQKSRPKNREARPSSGTFSENTLGWLLKNSPAHALGQPIYDLNRPPQIAKGALDSLRKRINQIPPMPQ